MRPFHLLLCPAWLMMWLLNCCCGAGFCGFNSFPGMLLCPPLHSDVSHWQADVASPCWCQPQMGLNWKFHGYPQWDLFLSTPDAAVFLLLLLWNWQAYWILPLPRILLVYWPLCTYACMLLYGRRHLGKSDITSDDVGSCSASGASSFCCAYC